MKPFDKFIKSYYICPDCEHEWDDVWDSACNDSCPECHANDIEPSDYEELEDYDWQSDRRMRNID